MMVASSLLDFDFEYDSSLMCDVCTETSFKGLGTYYIGYENVWKALFGVPYFFQSGCTLFFEPINLVHK